MKRKKTETGTVAAVCQLRSGNAHPFGAMRSFQPLGGGEEELAKIPMLVMVVAIMVLGEVVRVVSKRNRKPEDEFNGLTPELAEQWLLEEAAQAEEK